jgi:hypothetical protein
VVRAGCSARAPRCCSAPLRCTPFTRHPPATSRRLHPAACCGPRARARPRTPLSPPARPRCAATTTTTTTTTPCWRRMPVVDRYRDMGTMVMGKSEAGLVKVGDVLQVMPNK